MGYPMTDGLDVCAVMLVVVPAALGYGRAGSYPPALTGKRRFAVSPNALLVYEVEVE